jgi:hypothetical protein
MAAVGVDHDASVVPECANGKVARSLVDAGVEGPRRFDMLWTTTGTCDAYADTTKSAETRYSMVCSTT